MTLFFSTYRNILHYCWLLVVLHIKHYFPPPESNPKLSMSKMNEPISCSLVSVGNHFNLSIVTAILCELIPSIVFGSVLYASANLQSISTVSFLLSLSGCIMWDSLLLTMSLTYPSDNLFSILNCLSTVFTTEKRLIKSPTR